MNDAETRAELIVRLTKLRQSSDLAPRHEARPICR